MEKVIVVCFLALVITRSPVNAIDCVSLVAGLFPCTNYLSNFVPVAPSLRCCDSATTLVGKAVDSDGLCQCLRQNPLSSGFLPSKAQQLPNLCTLTSFLPLAKCLIPPRIPPSNIISPMIPLPPVVPGSPLIPLPPLIPGSASPLIPLPPLIPGSDSSLIPLQPLVPGSGWPLIPPPPLIPGSGSPLIPVPPVLPLPPMA